MKTNDWDNWSGFSGNRFTTNNRAITIQEVEQMYNQFWRPIDQANEIMNRIEKGLDNLDVPLW